MEQGRILEGQKPTPIITINRKVAGAFLAESPTVDEIVDRMV